MWARGATFGENVWRLELRRCPQRWAGLGAQPLRRRTQRPKRALVSALRQFRAGPESVPRSARLWEPGARLAFAVRLVNISPHWLIDLRPQTGALEDAILRRTRTWLRPRSGLPIEKGCSIGQSGIRYWRGIRKGSALCIFRGAGPYSFPGARFRDRLETDRT